MIDMSSAEAIEELLGISEAHMKAAEESLDLCDLHDLSRQAQYAAVASAHSLVAANYMTLAHMGLESLRVQKSEKDAR